MTYDKLMVDIGERLRDWHFAHPHAPTALYLGQAQKAVIDRLVDECGWCARLKMMERLRPQFNCFAIHFTEDADYCALG